MGHPPDCSVSDCETGPYSRGLCEMHYRRLLRNGTTDRVRPAYGSVECEVDACDLLAVETGLCHGHYLRLQRSGEPGPDPLREGFQFCVLETCGRAHHSNGYCAPTISGSAQPGIQGPRIRFGRRPAKAASTPGATARSPSRSTSATWSVGSGGSESTGW